jgi:cathepsin C
MENYLVSEEVEPFTAADGKCKSSKYENQERMYQVSNYRYIGGGYGMANEMEIMKEIKEKGPIVMNFNPDITFSYYKSGVFHLKFDDSDIEDADWVTIFYLYS